MRISKYTMLPVAVIAAAMSWSSVPAQAKTGVKIGVLKCFVDGGLGFVFGSSKKIRCYFQRQNSKARDWYTGSIDKFGVDLGYTKRGVMLWTVVAPTKGLKKGALEGSYGGISASVAAGYGVGANALIGGFQRSVALQPLSIEGVEGINIAAGIASLTLKAAPAPK